MATVKVDGHGKFSATATMTARFESMKKTELVKMIAEGHGDDGKGALAGRGTGVAHWRTFPKETLVVVAADMFATDDERRSEPRADEDTQKLKVGIPPATEPRLSLDEIVATNNARVAAALETEHVQVGDSVSPEQLERIRAAATTEPAPIAAPAAASAPAARGYRLRCTHTTGWLRRDQPRKPGDKATFKVVNDVTKASFYRTLRQAQAKLFEVAQLHDDREHQAELEEVSA